MQLPPSGAKQHRRTGSMPEMLMKLSSRRARDRTSLTLTADDASKVSESLTSAVSDDSGIDQKKLVHHYFNFTSLTGMVSRQKSHIW